MKFRNLSARLRHGSHRFTQVGAVLRLISTPADELTVLANQVGSDKGDLHHDRHHYTRVYSSLFEPIRHQPLRVLEIGLLHRVDRGWKNVSGRFYGTAIGSRAPSLEMWSSYFPNGTIFGFDINTFPDVDIDRCRIITGDMGNREDLSILVNESGGDFDIIIDDASHASHHQQIALGYLFPHLRAGGIYIIEDLCFQPPELEKAGATKTAELLRNAMVTGQFRSDFLSADEASYLSSSVAQIQFFDSAANGPPSRFVDALATLRKR
jgi:hypothetical protein